MCGFFIHGRSWVNREQEVTEGGLQPGKLFISGRAAGKTAGVDMGRLNLIDTFCAPMTINGHHLMPETPNKGCGKCLGEIGVRVDHWTEMTNEAIKYKAQKLSQAKHPDSYVVIKDVSQDRETGDTTYIFNSYQGKHGRYTSVVDWGLNPANGRFVPKCGNTMGPLREVEAEAKVYMLQGMSELVAWCQRHWGSLNDKEEFVEAAPSCLDYDKLRADLPERIKSFGMYKQGVGHVHGETQHLSAVIKQARNPRDRFIEMFKQAPNEYWQGIEARGGRKQVPYKTRYAHLQEGAFTL